ncbi:MAG: hypothetical protein HY741_23365 [Chloroflexi bacterium]|nr:hypothetical protein [Chloroflexota bacterium]
MEMTMITIPLDKETARIYNSASEEEQRKMQLLMRLFLKDFIISARPLDEIMDEASDEAERNGLTPEILDSILNDE